MPTSDEPGSIYAALRRLLFRIEPERVHGLTLQLLALADVLPPLRPILRGLYSFDEPRLRVRAFGLDFANPLGLAAGYDKDGRGIAGLACLGFGHLELGTVTPQAQPGNPRPRIFRLVEDEGLINRMGFPNAGAAPLLRRLQRRRRTGVILGVNIGKAAATPLERAADDYCGLLRTFAPVADYLAVNISSPNTVGLRRLQARDLLESLLRELAAERLRLDQATARRAPLLVKLAPDLSDAELEEAVAAVISAGMDGVIATNTTLARDGLRSPAQSESGGLSGAPLRARSTAVIRQIAGLTHGRLPIIGVGGVFGAPDVEEKLDAGACLVQVYTGLVYRGPGIARQILRALPLREAR